MEIKKPYAVVQCNKVIKGIDRADQYLSFYSVLRKTVKKKKVLLYLLNCALFNALFCVQETKYKHKSKVHELPAQGRKVLDIRGPESKLVQF